MFPRSIRRAFYRWAARTASRRLHSLSGERLCARAEKAALKAFRRAAARVPAYGRFLQDAGVQASRIASIDDFTRLVPLTDKDSVFPKNDITSLCVDGKADDAACIYTSSGFSGTFSFGLETHDDVQRGRMMLDVLLEMYCHVTRRPTLMISAMPMGVQIPVSLPLKLDAGTRPDTILAVIRKLKGVCKQVVIAAEHPFLKRIVEDGVEAGMNWPEYRVSLLTGADVIPENFRAYVDSILGHDPDDPDTGRTFVSAGISEVGLTMGHETDDCRRLRMAAAHDEKLRSAVFGQTPFLPSCVQYFPDDFYMETPEINGRSTLVVTTSPPRRKLPLIRYCTGDWAKVMTHRELCQALDACGRSDLRPTIELPLLLIWGRGQCVEAGGKKVFPEQVKEAIYADPAVAKATTANFRMAAEGESVNVRFQLKPGVAESDELREAFSEVLLTATGVHLKPELVGFHDFHASMDLSYERKFQYVAG